MEKAQQQEKKASEDAARAMKIFHEKSAKFKRKYGDQ